MERLIVLRDLLIQHQQELSQRSTLSGSASSTAESTLSAVTLSKLNEDMNSACSRLVNSCAELVPSHSSLPKSSSSTSSSSLSSSSSSSFASSSSSSSTDNPLFLSDAAATSTIQSYLQAEGACFDSFNSFFQKQNQRLRRSEQGSSSFPSAYSMLDLADSSQLHLVAASPSASSIAASYMFHCQELLRLRSVFPLSESQFLVAQLRKERTKAMLDAVALHRQQPFHSSVLPTQLTRSSSAATSSAVPAASAPLSEKSRRNFARCG